MPDARTNFPGDLPLTSPITPIGLRVDCVCFDPRQIRGLRSINETGEAAASC
jgi:hypothetical protein